MTEQGKKKSRAGYGDKVRNKERRSELTVKEKLNWITQLGFVGRKRVSIDLEHEVLRETLGMDGQERGWKRGLKRKAGNVTHQQCTVCLTKGLFFSHLQIKKLDHW